MSFSNATPSTPTPIKYISPARRGDNLQPGSYYQLELIGGKGTDRAEVGTVYLATDHNEKGLGTLLVHSGDGHTFFADATDVFTTVY